MEKTYILIIAGNNRYSMDAFDSFDEAKVYVDKLVNGQQQIEGELDIEHFGSECDNYYGKQRTTFYPFFGHVAYGVETTNSTEGKMYRVVFELVKH